jgi:hypothetical protein
MLKRNVIFVGLLSLLVVFAFANPLAPQQPKKQILLGNNVRSNPTVDPFLTTLEKVSPPHVHVNKAT